MTSAPDGIAYSVDGPVATVTLSRPDALNALTPTMLGRLGDVLDDDARNDSVRVVVLTGEGRAFSAGVDLKALAGREITNGSVGDILDIPARRATALLATMPKVTIAKVNGFCFTGALELAIACDLVLVADEAKLGDTHVKFGLRPTWGMSQRLIRLVGAARARDLSYTARTFTGTEAAQWGIAAASAPLADLDALVQRYVEQILANSGVAIAAYKDLYRAALDHSLGDGLRYEYGTTYLIDYDGARLDAYR
jgi:1,4-dihydroxy-2-naphthoyl-CoA synthase